MAKKTDEEKIVEKLAEVLDNNWFNPQLAASLIINHYPLYTLDKLMILISEIITQQDYRFENEWENGQTSEGLMLASHMAEVIRMHAPLV